jgi:hypothetical protein
MIVLALDTTSQAGSAALLRDSVVLQEVTGDLAVTQVQRLPMQLARLLEEAGVALAEVDLLAVSVGPGSFTGLRVGIAAMQGLAVAAGQTDRARPGARGPGARRRRPRARHRAVDRCAPRAGLRGALRRGRAAAAARGVGAARRARRWNCWR